MWHWNSLWARAPGDPPTIDDPSLWATPWTTEQALALQTRSWEAMLAASHSWWSMLLAGWPMVPAWPLPPWAAAPADPVMNSDQKAGASTGPEGQHQAAKQPLPGKAVVHKLPTTSRRRTTTQARKR